MNSLRLVLLAIAITVTSVAADRLAVVPLWANGAPGSEARKNEPEKTTPNGASVSNIHHPSLIVYLPAKDKATGAAVIVAPGGGHQNHAIQHEGYNVAQWLADHGVAAFILKYRLARDNANPTGAPQPYTVDRDALADAQRAMNIITREIAN